MMCTPCLGSKQLSNKFQCTQNYDHRSVLTYQKKKTLLFILDTVI